MKRYNNLFDKIVSLDNLYLADKKARRNKSKCVVIQVGLNIVMASTY